ncbi:hypothetical protein EMCRGX_G032238 [Ephydatia muelleri]
MALAAVLSLHVLLAARLARSEDDAERGASLHMTASALPQLTQQSSSGVDTKPIIHHAAAIGPLRTFIQQCNVSEDLYESYFMNRRLCKEPLLEDLDSTPAPSAQTILFTLRSTAGYHRKRLPVLFDTWLSDVGSASNCQVVIITDARDEAVERTAYGLGIDYVVTHCPTGHNRSQLCCKAGEELETVSKPPYDQFQWVCHVDDDMYVLMDVLMEQLSKLDPREDHAYVGRPNTLWHSRGLQVKDGAIIAKPGVPFDFALGGLYCLSRAMLVSIAPYLGTAKAFADVCKDVDEPDDVTLGVITGAVLRYPMVRTNLIHTHGRNLAATVNPLTLHKQLAISYGYGTHLSSDLSTVSSTRCCYGACRGRASWKHPLCSERKDLVSIACTGDEAPLYH